MSTVKTNNVQVGQSVTATNNFTLYQPATPDGTVRLGVGNTGATTADVITATSAGNVGIGTSSPSYKLDVSGSPVGQPLVRVQNPASHEATIRYTTAHSSSSDYKVGASITVANAFEIYSVAAGASRAIIDSSGGFLFKGGSADLYLNQTATSRYWQHNKASSEGSGFTYHVFQNNGSGIGSITWNGSGTSFNTTSDYRLKENVQPMVGALSKVAALKPCTYTWKADGSAGEGFIAHELAAVAPQCVAGEKDAVDADGNPVYQGIDTSFLVATLTAAIQEQQAIIESLTARIAALEAA